MTGLSACLLFSRRIIACPLLSLQHAGVSIEPPIQTRLVDATCSLPGLLCAGVPGAGGVDAVFAIVVHADAEEGVRQLWASWQIGGEGVQEAEVVPANDGLGAGGAGHVCPLLLTASEGGLEGGMLLTRKMSWR